MTSLRAGSIGKPGIGIAGAGLFGSLIEAGSQTPSVGTAMSLWTPSKISESTTLPSVSRRLKRFARIGPGSKSEAAAKYSGVTLAAWARLCRNVSNRGTRGMQWFCLSSGERGAHRLPVDVPAVVQRRPRRPPGARWGSGPRCDRRGPGPLPAPRRDLQEIYGTPGLVRDVARVVMWAGLRDRAGDR